MSGKVLKLTTKKTPLRNISDFLLKELIGEQNFSLTQAHKHKNTGILHSKPVALYAKMTAVDAGSFYLAPSD